MSAGDAVPATGAAKQLETLALSHGAVFGDASERDAARWLLWELGQVQGVRPASINGLYLARGRGERVRAAHAIAMGADRAILVQTDTAVEPLAARPLFRSSAAFASREREVSRS